MPNTFVSEFLTSSSHPTTNRKSKPDSGTNKEAPDHRFLHRSVISSLLARIAWVSPCSFSYISLGYSRQCYLSSNQAFRLSGSSIKSITPITNIPSSVRHGLIWSFTTMIFWNYPRCDSGVCSPAGSFSRRSNKWCWCFSISFWFLS